MTAPIPESIRLTDREREVLRLVCAGLTSKLIGRVLGIHAKTVEFHKGDIADKIGSRSIAGMVRYAIRTGLIEP